MLGTADDGRRSRTADLELQKSRLGSPPVALGARALGFYLVSSLWHFFLLSVAGSKSSGSLALV